MLAEGLAEKIESAEKTGWYGSNLGRATTAKK